MCLLKDDGKSDVEGRSRAVLLNLTVPSAVFTLNNVMDEVRVLGARVPSYIWIQQEAINIRC